MNSGCCQFKLDRALNCTPDPGQGGAEGIPEPAKPCRLRPRQPALSQFSLTGPPSTSQPLDSHSRLVTNLEDKVLNILSQDQSSLILPGYQSWRKRVYLAD